MGNSSGKRLQRESSSESLKPLRSASKESGGSSNKIRDLPAEAIIAAAEACGCTSGQLEFLKAWLGTVYQAALPHCGPKGKKFSMCTDLAHLEISIDGPCSLLSDLMRQFVAECEVQAYAMTEQMQQVLEETQVSTMIVWCRLTRVGSNAPGADAGYCVMSTLEWMLIDLLMPPTQDHHLFRQFAQQNLIKPALYGSSVFPESPERFVGVEINGQGNKALICAFFFFKALGFTKPENNTIQLLASCPARACLVINAVGPQGLTHMVMKLVAPRRPLAEDLAQTCAGFEYSKAVLDKLTVAIGGEPDCVDYRAEARGFTVAVWWFV